MHTDNQAAERAHNHVTRDIKPLGVCPACDRVYEAVAARERERRRPAPAVVRDDRHQERETR